MAFEIKNNILIKYIMQEEVGEFKTEDGIAKVVIRTSTVIVPNGVVEIGKKAFENCKEIEKVILPEGVKKINSYAFKGCVKLKAVDLPNGLENICESAFFGCSKLSELELPLSIKTVGARVFKDCKSLEVINFPETMTEVPVAIFEYSGIKRMVLPKGIKTIKERAFRGSKIEEIVLQEGVELIEMEAFYECYHLTKINFPDTLKKIERLAFNSCDSLAKIELPPHSVFEALCFCGTAIECFNIPEAMTIVPFAFSACKNLKDVNISKGVKIIGHGAFENMYSLEKIVLPEGLEEISDMAFSCCKAVYAGDGILIPKTVKKIGELVFRMPGWAEREGIKENLKVYKNSYAEQYLKEHGINYVIVD